MRVIRLVGRLAGVRRCGEYSERSVRGLPLEDVHEYVALGRCGVNYSLEALLLGKCVWCDVEYKSHADF